MWWFLPMSEQSKHVHKTLAPTEEAARPEERRPPLKVLQLMGASKETITHEQSLRRRKRVNLSGVGVKRIDMSTPFPLLEDWRDQIVGKRSGS